MAPRRIAVVLLMLVALVACADSGGDSAISVQEPIGAPDDGAAASVVKDASIEMRVGGDELTDAAQKVIDISTSPRIAGFLVSSALDLETGYGFGRVVVKVPAAKFEEAVTHLSGIGKLTRQHLQGNDLSSEVLAAAATSAEARRRIANLLSRLDETEDRGARYQLRQDLATARKNLRKVENNETYLAAQTNYSTVEVAMTGMAPPTRPKPVFDRAWSTATAIVAAIASGVVLAAGAIVPLGLIAAIAYILGAAIVRRLRVKTREVTG